MTPREQRRIEGMCADCHAPARPTFRHCGLCAKLRRAYQQTRNRTRGIQASTYPCKRCGQPGHYQRTCEVKL